MPNRGGWGSKQVLAEEAIFMQLGVHEIRSLRSHSTPSGGRMTTYDADLTRWTKGNNACAVRSLFWWRNWAQWTQTSRRRILPPDAPQPDIIKTRFDSAEANGRTAALATYIRAPGLATPMLTKDATKRRRPRSSPASTGMWPIMEPCSRLIPPSTEGI